MKTSIDIVDIVDLPPMRVVSFFGFGPQPEDIAIQKMAAWVKKYHYWNEKTRMFGFNNPNPAPGSENYGYEVWISITDELPAESDAPVKNFDGGKYARLRCPVQGKPENIVESWQMLARWLEGTHYQLGSHQWLEEHIGGPDVDFNDLILDLYAPIRG